ncbi:g5662 [Coccomyxa elongata]
MEVATGGSSGHVDANAPDYIRNPHRLPMSHVLFTDGNLAREVLAKQTLQSTPENDQDGVTKESAALHSRAGSRLSDWPRFQCTTCHLKLPNEHLLDIHVLEVHDSFFAAQAARHMKVFQCLVEGCAKTFHSPADRRKHLWDQHCYPRDFNYHLMHLGKHQGQYGPRKEPQHLVPAILESMEAVTESQFDAQSKAHSGNVVHAATAVAVAPQQTERRSCDIEFSWAEQRRLLEESYNATPAPETIIAVPSPSSRVEVGKQTDKSGQQGNETEQGPSSQRAKDAADVRRMRQRRRAVVDPLATTEEAAEAKQLAKWSRELESGRKGVPGSSMLWNERRDGRKCMDDAVTSFIHSMGNTGLLSRQMEAYLSRIIQKGVRHEKAVNERQVELQRLLTPAEIVEMQGLQSEEHLEMLMNNLSTARGLMLQYNLRLVISIAKHFVGRGVELQDIIQEGILGLMRAVDKFEASKGFKFSTYAHWWIRQAASRCVSDQSRVVRLPQHILEANKRINQVRAELAAKDGYGRMIPDEEVAALLGISAAKVAFYTKAAQPIKSLDQPAAMGGSYKDNSEEELLRDVIDGDEVEGADDSLTAKLSSRIKEDVLQHDINTVLFTLPARERNVIRMRYGLHRQDGRGMTLSDLSAAYGLTKERIRQLEESALQKLRRHKSVLTAHLPVAGSA